MPVPKATEPSDIHNQFHDNDYHNNLLVYSSTNNETFRQIWQECVE